MTKLPKIVAGVFAILAILLLVQPPSGLAPESAWAGALCLATLGLLASGLIPEFVSAILFFLAAMIFAISPPEVVFSGFSSAALWMVFAGLIIAVAVRLTGLGERIARFLAPRFGNSYVGVISGIMVIGVALAFVMPATMGRIMLLAPVVLSLADRFGFAEGRPGRTGMVLALGFGTFLVPMAILPANVPNLVLVGAAETLYGVTPLYGSYLALHFPVLGLLKAAAIVAVIVLLFPDKPLPAEAESAKPVGGGEGRLALMLVLALVLWSTDFVHHVSPAWVALAVAVLCLIPGIGAVSAQVFREKVDLAPFFYVAGVLGLGGVVAASGLGDLLGQKLIAAAGLSPGQDGWTYAVMAAVGILAGPLVTNPGIPVVLTPLAGGIAEASGLPVATIVMMIVMGFSSMIFPFQAAPIVVIMQICGVRLGDAVKCTLGILAVTVILLLPLNYLWWRYLGYLQ